MPNQTLNPWDKHKNKSGKHTIIWEITGYRILVSVNVCEVWNGSFSLWSVGGDKRLAFFP